MENTHRIMIPSHPLHIWSSLDIWGLEKWEGRRNPLSGPTEAERIHSPGMRLGRAGYSTRLRISSVDLSRPAVQNFQSAGLAFILDSRTATTFRLPGIPRTRGIAKLPLHHYLVNVSLLDVLDVCKNPARIEATFNSNALLCKSFYSATHGPPFLNHPRHPNKWSVN